MEDVGPGKLGQGARDDRRRDERLADLQGDRRTNDRDAVLDVSARELRQVLVGQDTDLVAAAGEALGEVLDIERQPRHVRPVVVDRHQDLHFPGRPKA